MFHYHIDPDSDMPIYRQLVDQINAQIRSGVLPYGTQLPTVRQMAEKLQLSGGTVKHVYDCLQDMGDIEMTRRRGTFVKYVHKDKDSRKQQAMNAIDQMIRRLSDLNFSPAEIQIFLNIKMREWGVKWSGVRMTIATEYAELAAGFEKQLSQIPNVHVDVCPLDQLQEYPYNINEHSDVILSSVEDAQRLSVILPDSAKLVRIALHADSATVVTLSALGGGCIGVLCEKPPFADLVKKYLPDSVRRGLVMLQAEATWPDLDVLILPEGYEERCGEVLRQQLATFRREKQVVDFVYRLDAGSMLYLEERISKLRDERQLWPGALHF